MNRGDVAVGDFRNGANCSQAVLRVFADEYGLDPDAALSIARGFGRGMGRGESTCGAVTGAVMVIGLACGGRQAGGTAANSRASDLVRDFFDRFATRRETTVCRELLDHDVSTPHGYEQAAKLGLFATRCPRYVRDAVDILEEILED
jgi:C_GCAxxG_C_C family probable redox protein